MTLETDLERELNAELKRLKFDREDELRNLEALRAIDLPHPATFAFGLWMQWPAEAAIMMTAEPTPDGYRVRIRDPFDGRLANLRRLGMLSVIGHKPTVESIALGRFITGFAEEVRRELVILRKARE